uniref:Exocyst complex component 2 n=1 Tax=Macrostomum lignano TaxID=282301 RepID=A0A1I8H3G4_9PLAT
IFQSSPDINGISPRSGPPGTAVTIRGTYLGSSQDSIVALYICGFDCTLWAEWKSSKKIVAISGQTRLGPGAIVLVLGNEKGERVKCNCLVEFTVEALSVGLCDEWSVWPETDKSLFETQELKPSSTSAGSVVDHRRDRSASESAAAVAGSASSSVSAAGDPSADLLSADFDPVKFLLANYQGKSAPDLDREVRSLRTSVSADPAQAVGFLKPHLNDVFKGLDELDSLRRVAEQEQSQLQSHCLDTQRLLRDCNRIAGELFQAALNRKDHTDTLRNAIHVMEKSRGLFNLPGVLDAHMRAGNHKLAIDEYLRGKARYGSTRVPTFLRVWEQVESRATVLRRQLLNRLMPPTPQQQQQQQLDDDSSSHGSASAAQSDGPLPVDQHAYLVRQLQRLGAAKAAEDSLAYLRQRYLAGWWRRRPLGEFLRHYARLIGELQQAGIGGIGSGTDPLGDLAISWVNLQRSRLRLAGEDSASSAATEDDYDDEEISNIDEIDDYGDAGADNDDDKQQQQQSTKIDDAGAECRAMRQNLAGVSPQLIGPEAAKQLARLTSRLRLRYLSRLKRQYAAEVAGLRGSDDWPVPSGASAASATADGSHSQLPLVTRVRWGPHIRAAVSTLMCSFCDRLRKQLRAVAASPSVASSASVSGFASLTTGSSQQPLQQQPTTQQCSRLLAVQCDASFAYRHPNRRILASLRAEGHEGLESMAAEVNAYYDAFLDELKAAYVEEKARAIYGPLEAKMLRAGFTWARCAPPAAPRLYVRDALHSVGEVLAEISGGFLTATTDESQKQQQLQQQSVLVGGRAYAEDVLKQVVGLLVQELHRCFTSVTAWCRNGRLQAYLDVRILDDLLSPYITYDSRGLLRAVYSAINSESGRTVLTLTTEETQLVDRIVRKKDSFWLQLWESKRNCSLGNLYSILADMYRKL